MTINVRQFVYDNITPYEGDASFLQWPTDRTKKLWEKCCEYLKEERDNNGLRSADPSTISTITSHKPGYIEKDLETIVGLQTDEPLKRAIKPFGWVRVVEKALNERWMELDPRVKESLNMQRITMMRYSLRMIQKSELIDLSMFLHDFQIIMLEVELSVIIEDLLFMELLD